ncbi:BTAD domain-containing putative transcriptional regulator [Streptomyces sp. NPDC002076]
MNRYRLLGPLEAEPATPTAGKVRTVLATLLLRAREVVPSSTLIDEVWPDGPPRSAPGVLQVYVSQLRTALQPPAPGPAARLLLHVPPGYRLDSAPGDTDLEVFAGLAGQGQEAYDAEDFATAARQLGRALALWRGPAFSGVPQGPLLSAAAVRLEEQRLTVLERRIAAELRLGRHAALVGELLGLTTEHPYREVFHAHLMVALYRCGRQGEALHRYDRLRRMLADELGTDPGRGLRRLHQRILRSDPALLTAPAADRNAGARTRLPERARQFTGRERLLTEAGSLLTAGGPAGPAVLLLAGTAGVGKTAVALELAHRHGGAFPGGAVFAAVAAQEDRSGRALRAILRALDPGAADGADADIRHRVAEALREPRRLLVLDGLDGSDAEAELTTVTALLPAATLLVTTRHTLTGPGGTRHLPVDPLPQGEAERLLRAVLEAGTEGGAGIGLGGGSGQAGSGFDGGPGRTGAGSDDASGYVWSGSASGTAPGGPGSGTVEPGAGAEPAGSAVERGTGAGGVGDDEAVRDVVRACGGLPAAVRAAGMRLAERPHWSLRTLADALTDPGALLDLPTRDPQGPDLRARLLGACRPLSAPARRAFRLSALAPRQGFPLWTLAALLGADPTQAAGVAAELTALHLLLPRRQGGGAEPWYDCLPPARALALDLLHTEEPTESRRAAVRRLAGACAALARHADRLLAPGRGPAREPEAEAMPGWLDPARIVAGDPAAWFGTALPGLTTAAGHAHAARLWPQVWRLADAASGYLEASGHWDTWAELLRAARDAGRRARRPDVLAGVERSLGDLAWQRRRIEEAAAHYRQALAYADLAAGGAEAGRALVGLADSALSAGDPAGAEALYRQALEPTGPDGTAGGDERCRTDALRGLALAELAAGRLPEALQGFTRFTEAAERLGDNRWLDYGHRTARRILRYLTAAEHSAPPAEPPALEVRPGVWLIRERSTEPLTHLPR